MQIRRDNSPHSRSLGAVAENRDRSGQRSTASAEQSLEVCEACPDSAVKETTDFRPIHPDFIGETLLRLPRSRQVATHKPRHLVLYACCTTFRTVVIWARPPFGVITAKPPEGRREPIRRPPKIHRNPPHWCIFVAQSRQSVRPFTIQWCTANEKGMATTESVLETYTSTLPPTTWMQVRDFVRGTVRFRFTAGRSSRDVERALNALTGFAEWVLLTGIGNLDDSVLRADVIDAYTAQRLADVSAPVAGRERKLLRTLAGLENSPEPRNRETSAPPSQPYTRDEQDEIAQWAEWQSTEGRRRQCRAIAALALGCGLTSAEMLQVRIGDILLLSDGMAAVDTAGRVVPVTAEWNDSLAVLHNGSTSQFVIAPNAASRKRNTLLGTIRRAGYPSPSPQRMRVTWLLNHIDGATPLNTLIEAAGLTSPDMLRRLLPFAVRLEGENRTTALRLAQGGVR